MFDCDGDDVSLAQSRILWALTIITSTLSCIGASFMLKSFLKFGKAKRISVMVSMLALGDYIWGASAIACYAILLTNKDWFTFPVCVIMRALFQIFAGSTIFWCAAISIYVCREVTTSNVQEELVPLTMGSLNKLRHQSAQEKRNRYLTWTGYLFLGYSIPVTGTVINIAADQIYQSDIGLCFPEDPWHWILWFIPNTVGILVTAVCYIVIQRDFRKRKISASFWDFWRSDRNLAMPAHYRISLYLVVMFTCWPLDILNFLLATVFGFTPCQLFPLSVAYSTILQLQGALNALVFAITNRQFRDYYSRTSTGRLFLFIIFSPLTLWVEVFRSIGRGFQPAATMSSDDHEGHLTDDQEIVVSSTRPRIHLVA